MDVEGQALVNVQGDTLAGVETKTQENTVDEKDAEGEVDTIHDTLPKVQSK